MKLGRKIAVALIILLIVDTIFNVAFVSFGLMDLKNNVTKNCDDLGKMAESTSSESMTDQIKKYMTDVTVEKASLADKGFEELATAVSTMAYAVDELYANSEKYEAVEIDRPDKANDGVLAVQLLYSKDVVLKKNKPLLDEIGLLGNGALLLKTINEHNSNIVSNYIATETGLMIQADFISGSKFDEEGNVLPYEAKERAWYIGAKNTNATFFTPVSKDAHGTGNGIMCGVPFYKEGELAGVCGAGMYLDNVKNIVMDSNIGENGYACVINQNGQVIFSNFEEGLLAVRVEDDADVRDEASEKFAEILNAALSMETGLEKTEVDEVTYYVAYAPMETIGWTYITLIAEEEVIAPTNVLMEKISVATDSTIMETKNASDLLLKQLVIMALVAILVSAIISLIIASGLTKNIKVLTKKVEKVSGDDLEFDWDINTRDEVQVLAKSFGALTDRMKSYIREITSITAEKERIGAELNVATKIQADMLPSVFPAFPNRKEFDIYATMDPAKEVGGDFYDFFMVDETHLAMVMADVSGKGVPAALFMVISKTLLKNTAQNGLAPAEVLAKVNDLLCEGNEEAMFVTVWLGILDITTGEMEYANGGHEYPAVMRAGGEFELIDENHDFVLAAMPGMPYASHNIKLEKGDRFFVYTDGVPEQINSKEELYGTDRMLEVLNQNKESALDVTLSRLKRSIDTFAGSTPQFDDITMLEITFFGECGKEDSVENNKDEIDEEPKTEINAEPEAIEETEVRTEESAEFEESTEIETVVETEVESEEAAEPETEKTEETSEAEERKEENAMESKSFKTFKEFTVPATDEELINVQNYIDSELEKANCGMAVQTQIDIAVEEIFVNIAHYAYENEADDTKKKAYIEVNVEGEPPVMTIVFADGGVPYNPLDKEDPDITLSAEERSIGGLGIYMVKQSMDEVKYEYKDNMNVLTLIKTIS